MTEKRIPPFYSNSDTHCFQAGLKMAVEYFEPDRQWTFDELDDFTGKVEGEGTWPMKTWAGLSGLGYDLVIYDFFDYHFFVQDPVACIQKYWNGEYAEFALGQDLEAARQHAALFLTEIKEDRIKYIQAGFTKENIIDLLNTGYLILASVDWGFLNTEKYDGEGHMLLIFDYERSGNLIAHDPGGEKFPSYPNRIISIEILMKAATVNENGDKMELWAIKK